nr:reverse transcriptase domain-containing protein [Tanacetum cinerariifolium]
TAVSSPFGGLSDIRSSSVDGPPVMPEDLYAYVVAAFQAPPSPDYVPGPEYLPLQEYPLPAAISHTVDSPGYVPESDSEEDPKENPADYPADGGDDDDDDDESSDDDEENDDVEEDEDEEEDEHLAPVDSTAIALPAVDHAPSAEETEPFETDESAATPPPHLAYCVTARMSIKPQTPISFPSDTEIARLMAIPTPPPSALSPWSSPLPQIPSLPLPLPPPLPTSPTYPLGYRAAMIRLRADATSTSHPLLLPSIYHLTPPSGTPSLLPIPLSTPSPPLLPPSTDPRADVREVFLPPRKRLCYTFGLRFEVGKSSSAPTVRPAGDSRPDYRFIATLNDEIMRDPERDVGYGITDSWDEIVKTIQEAPTTDETDLGRDRHAHAHTYLLMERKSRMSWEAWRRAIDACDFVRFENIALRTHVVAQRSKIMELRATDRRRHAQFIEALRLLMRLQTQMTEFERQQGLAKELPHYNCGPDVAYAMTWADLKKKMTDKYCPRVEMKKLEFELWNLKVKGTDVIGYNQRFQELALMCVRMFPEESDKIERYVGGLPDMIHGSVVASKPKTTQEAIEMTTELIDKNTHTHNLKILNLRADVREVCLPPRKRLCYTFGLRFEVGESSSAPTVRPAGDSRPDYRFIATLDDEIMRDPQRDVRYGITDSWDEIVETMQGALMRQSGSTSFRDREVAGSRPQETDIVYRGTKTADETLDLDDRV